LSNSQPLTVLFFGTPGFAAYGLKQLIASPDYQVKCVVTQPDRPSGRGARVQPPPVKELAQANSIHVLQPQSIKQNKQDFLAELKALGPFDIGVVIAFGQILPLDVLSCPLHGCVNVHASLLPRWRGAAPIQRAIMSGDRETGVCLMKMDEGLDTGPVYSSTSVPIKNTDTFGTLHDKMQEAGGELLKNDLKLIARGEISAQTQADVGVTYAKKITKDESRIDWSKSAGEVMRLIRGLSPAPGAYTELDGKRIKILWAEEKAAGLESAVEKAGSIVMLDKNLLEIQCGSGVISVKEVQSQGKKKMPVSDFLLGASLKKGMMFN